ncbi:MAG: TonB family protein [Gammaproteobacteria bacterium]|nr:TonB family protein [Gammaproteobacteria bacterium]MBU1440101.1 TonB family protein [Gammaproteobacteria bacterium]MBU2286507.1 TonB family protein [Gammaproteobacteria bacterium]
MESVAPPFLARLGLNEQADERTIRRTYARLLKQTDQETDPEGFQSLRGAYEIALAWRQHVGSPASTTDTPAGENPVDPALAPADTGHRSSSQQDDAFSANVQVDPRLGDKAAELAKAEVARNSEQLAHNLVDQLRSQLAAGWPKDRAAVTAWLDATLDEPRMADMDARFLFEGGVAITLAEGWTPGRDLLLGPAISHFGWKDDRGRLAAFGQAGGIVATAIAELEFFDSQPDADRAIQRDLIRRLRDSTRPSTSVLLKQMPLLEQLAERFPHWLHLIADTEAIARWREWSVQVPGWRRWFVRKRPVATGRGLGSKPRIHYRWGLAVFLGLGALLRLFENTPQVPAPPSGYSGSASSSRPSSATGGQSQPNPVDQLLGNATISGPAARNPSHRTPGPSPRAESTTSFSATANAGASYSTPPLALYPPKAKRDGREGRVVVKAIVQTDGIARDATVHQSSGSDDLDNAAIVAVLNAVFIPAKDRSGKAMSAAYLIPINFKLSDAKAAPRSSPGDYAAAVSNAVRPYIFFDGKVQGNPAVEVTLRLARDGRIEDYRLSKSSGVSAWDLAVVRAIRSVPRIPVDHDGKVPSEMVIVFRPKV